MTFLFSNHHNLSKLKKDASWIGFVNFNFCSESSSETFTLIRRQKKFPCLPWSQLNFVRFRAFFFLGKFFQWRWIFAHFLKIVLFAHLKAGGSVEETFVYKFSPYSKFEFSRQRTESHFFFFLGKVFSMEIDFRSFSDNCPLLSILLKYARMPQELFGISFF